MRVTQHDVLSLLGKYVDRDDGRICWHRRRHSQRASVFQLSYARFAARGSSR